MNWTYFNSDTFSIFISPIFLLLTSKFLWHRQNLNLNILRIKQWQINWETSLAFNLWDLTANKFRYGKGTGFQIFFGGNCKSRYLLVFTDNNRLTKLLQITEIINCWTSRGEEKRRSSGFIKATKEKRKCTAANTGLLLCWRTE